MREALLCYVAVPYTQQVLDLLNILSLSIERLPISPEEGKDFGIFIYNNELEPEEVDHESEWVINDEDVLNVLTLYANKDLNSICAYLNSIPNRPFNVFSSATNKSI